MKLAGALAVAVLMVSSTGMEAQTPASRKVIVSAVDKDGVPVKDLVDKDLEIKIAGKTQTILGVQPAEGPMRIALLVADGGSGGFQRGVAEFVQKLYGRAEFQFTSVIIQPEKLGPFAADRNGIAPALNKLGPRGTQRAGAQLTEAILDATKDIKTETSRPVIVVARIGGEGQSNIDPRLVRAELQKSKATLFVISISGANRRPASTTESAASDPLSQMRAQMNDSEAADSQTNMASILGDGAKESGGRHDEVVTTTMVKAFESIADELLGQYEVSVTVPDNVKPTDRVSVSAKRKGLTVRAPAR